MLCCIKHLLISLHYIKAKAHTTEAKILGSLSLPFSLFFFFSCLVFCSKLIYGLYKCRFYPKKALSIRSNHVASHESFLKRDKLLLHSGALIIFSLSTSKMIISGKERFAFSFNICLCILLKIWVPQNIFFLFSFHILSINSC